MSKPVIRPTPRLQFVWRESTEAEQESSDLGDMRFACDYGIVLPVCRNDVRSNVYDDEADVELYGVKSEVFYIFRTTLAGRSRPPEKGEIPFRDGAHARWDGEVLGGLEVWVEDYFGDLTKVARQSGETVEVK